MKLINLLLVFLLMCSSLTSFSQTNYAIKGAVIDSATRQKLQNATICVLTAKDSMLVRFARASEDGSFSIRNLPKGNFIMMVTYPEYADYVDHFKLDSTKTSIDFGKLNLILKSRLLAEVIVKSEKASIKIKGDTTEYNAGSFKVQPNAKVEDLLKQLPGIQVDKDGKITAQGETVNKVLVDGEEFFGDDPTLVTKNVRADMVDKVQLYDKKSDQATFTGIDDGQKTKTINIKLKEDKKNGFFGKAEAGVGTDKFYQEQVAFNAFKAKEKLAVYGTMANTGKIGLGWQDAQKYASSNNVTMMDDGGIAISGGGSDELESFSGQYNGKGIPTARTAGAHYDGKWNTDKESINTNYKVGTLNVDGTDRTLTQNNLPTGTINGTNDQNYTNYMFRHKLDATYQIKFDTTSNLKVLAEGTARNAHNINNYAANSVRGNDILLNQSNRTIDNHTDGKVFHANAFWAKKFKKKGRTFSWNIDESFNQNDAHGYLSSNIKYYNNTGIQDSTQSVNQYKTNNTQSSVFRNNITYTEPLAKKISLVLNYGLSLSNSTADRKSFNQSSPGVYNRLDTLYSNDYKFNQLYNEGGAMFNYTGTKNTLNFGTRAAAVTYKQVNEYTNAVYNRDFVNWNPQAMYLYRFSKQGSFRVSYNGRTSQPSIDQLQPIRINTDPLNITLGNPDLKPSFQNQFSVNYYSYKVLTDQYVSLYGSYNFTNNPIVSNTTTDSAGKSTYQYVNIGSKNSSSFNTGLYAGRKIKAIGLNIGFNGYMNGNTSYNYVNNILNMTKSASYNASLSLSKYAEKKYDLYISAGPNYTVSKSSLQRINNNGSGINGDFYFNVYLPKQFQINTEGNYQYRGKTASFNEDFERFLWNATISKSFFKERNLKLSLTGYDLLNQNKGFNRYAGGNILTQQSYTTIRRYYLLSLVWDFSKMGGAVKK